MRVLAAFIIAAALFYTYTIYDYMAIGYNNTSYSRSKIVDMAYSASKGRVVEEIRDLCVSSYSKSNWRNVVRSFGKDYEDIEEIVSYPVQDGIASIFVGQNSKRSAIIYTRDNDLVSVMERSRSGSFCMSTRGNG